MAPGCMSFGDCQPFLESYAFLGLTITFAMVQPYPVEVQPCPVYLGRVEPQVY